MARLQDVILQGTRANQPVASSVPAGTLYGVTDENNLIERSNGSAWVTYSPSGSGITQLTGEVLAGPGVGSQAATLSTTGVVAGTYGATGVIPIITVNNKGRLTSVTTTAVTQTTGITQLTGDGTAGPGSGSQALTLSTTGVTAGVYGTVGVLPIITVDAKGRLTSVTTTAITSTTGITELTGDVLAGPGSLSQAATLSTTGVTPGTYGTTGFIPRLTVDLKGRITAITTTAEASGGMTQLTGEVTAGPGTGSQAATIAAGSITPAKVTNALKTFPVGTIVNGSGSVITAGIYGYIPVDIASTIVGWTVAGDAIGSIVFRILMNDPLSVYPPTTIISASAPPQLSSQSYATSSVLTGWTTTVPAGRVIGIEVVSASIVKLVTIQLTLRAS